MAKRKLKRQLGLVQVIMLGTAGTIAAEIFVLTGHAAGIAGPDTVLALIIGGILTLSIALNYCELATTYPVTGGAMAYVREAYGNNLIMFLVGSLGGLSSTSTPRSQRLALPTRLKSSCLSCRSFRLPLQ